MESLRLLWLAVLVFCGSQLPRRASGGPRSGGRWWELGAALSLARLWKAQGRPNEARELLASIYAWFTEGFDTVNLVEAKVLLDELA